MQQLSLTCVSCPIGCILQVEMADNRIISVTGNLCRRGLEYAENECTRPRRALSTTLPVTGGNIAVVPVKTQYPVPKDSIAECMAALRTVSVQAPIREGQVMLADVAGTGIDVVATRPVAVHVPTHE